MGHDGVEREKRFIQSIMVESCIVTLQCHTYHNYTTNGLKHSIISLQKEQSRTTNIYKDEAKFSPCMHAGKTCIASKVWACRALSAGDLGVKPADNVTSLHDYMQLKNFTDCDVNATDGKMPGSSDIHEFSLWPLNKWNLINKRTTAARVHDEPIGWLNHDFRFEWSDGCLLITDCALGICKASRPQAISVQHLAEMWR